ncbi:MAG: DMT family transporter [Burkholderiales bacterium]|nr:DMT family transporter [Burkholderiales bacterium]
MVASALLLSIAGVVTRQLEAARAFEITFWRSVFAGLFVLAALAFEYRGAGAAAALRATGRSIAAVGRPGLCSGACFAAMYVCFIVALTMTTVANTLVVVSLAPVFTALLARVVLGVRVPARTRAAIAAAFAGMLWMFGAGFSAGEPRHALGMLIALGVPLAAAVNVVTLTHASARVNLVPAVFIGALISVVATLPFALPFEASARDLALLAGLGVFQLGLPCVLLIVASRRLSAAEVSLLALIEIVAGPIWAWLGAGEVPSGATIAGGLVVLAALAWNELPLLRRALSA